MKYEFQRKFAIPRTPYKRHERLSSDRDFVYIG